MSKPNHVATIGFLCEWFQRSYQDVTAALEAAGVKPALVIDLTIHYDFREAEAVLGKSRVIHG